MEIPTGLVPLTIRVSSLQAPVPGLPDMPAGTIGLDVRAAQITDSSGFSKPADYDLTTAKAQSAETSLLAAAASPAFAATLSAGSAAPAAAGTSVFEVGYGDAKTGAVTVTGSVVTPFGSAGPAAVAPVVSSWYGFFAAAERRTQIPGT